MKDPVGLAVSKPFAVDQGSPRDLTWSWMFLAVRSMERAEMFKELLMSVPLKLGTQHRRSEMRLAIAGNMVHCFARRDVPSTVPNDDTQLNFMMDHTSSQ